jgi:hypothetical protein
MDVRTEKARELADRGRVVKQDGYWFVFSITSSEKYRVTLHPALKRSRKILRTLLVYKLLHFQSAMDSLMIGR